MEAENSKTNTHKGLAILTIGHFINDVHAAFLPTFTPILMMNLGLSITQASMLTFLSGIINSFMQPLLGYASDQTSRPLMILIGPILAALGASLIPSSPSYALAFFFVGLWAIGSATFHPQGQGSVGHLTTSQNLSFAFSIFSVGGILASALSPLYGAYLYQRLGEAFLPIVTSIPVLLYAMLVFKFLPTIPGKHAYKSSVETKGLKFILHSMKTTFAPLSVAVIRDTSIQGIQFFMPIAIAAKGGTIGDVGKVLFIIMIARSISPLLGGYIADRTSKAKIIFLCMAMGGALLIPAALTKGVLSVLLFTLGAACIEATTPITGAISQEWMPHSRAMASSIVMGFAWGLGSLLIPPLGIIGDHLGLTCALVVVGALPLASLCFVSIIRKKEKAAILKEPQDEN
ncbi:MAG: MFS transporter [Acetomicrobium sp.]|uniref:MFS transporter n=1 Tax=Acetomicrobium TaxID=49894 RepID=UPI0016AD5DA8|nr:MFS transporter [Acetomicrobium mobile]MDI9377204.1 MFS transporter [Synergistota bacterium]NLI43046.1 MFS transporter [Synergistaceae bacterium]HOB10405.1 MFS transporter [Acetomicrobium sp.]HPT65556.1 MFS transporter [Acetomicrobium sp.]HQA36528.1 MFS transporter [Acetomicrobium sp.]